MRVLSKSRFKLGLDCPNKLYYIGKPEYINSREEDPFLKALANGGYQVEELAKLHYPMGEYLSADIRDYLAQVEETRRLMEKNEVIIYEAAFLFDGLFVRTDILVKNGNHIKIIEVKAKSFEKEKTQFVGVRNPNQLDGKMKPYVLDLTFQWHVVSLCYPDALIDAYFMMADKSLKANINGLNQLFRINQKGREIIRNSKVNSISDIGSTVLIEIKMTDLALRIRNGELECSEGVNFLNAVEMLKNNYIEDHFAGTEISYSKCKKCEFKKTNHTDAGRSGIEECYQHSHQKPNTDVYKPNVLDVWHFQHAGDKLLKDHTFLLEEIDENDLKIENDKKPGMSRTQRQWLQIDKTKNSTIDPHFEMDELRIEMAQWKYPLHFIDFETSAPALPFITGMRPYENVSFQFSHHVMHEDGRVEHAGEFICVEPGVFPNFLFVTELYEQLKSDDGSIFRYSNHENTVLNHIIKQLEDSNFPTRKELIDFLLSITEVKDKQSKHIRRGERSMIDLCYIVQRFYYHPFMKGSNSLKYVLPAILNSSDYLKIKYSNTIGEINLSSRNFDAQHRWIQDPKDIKIDPYQSLPPVYDGKSANELDEYFGDLDEIGNGGAAMTAYGLLQYTDMTTEQRDQLIRSLLKYCELDTLAMVMLVEYFQYEILRDPNT
jgi:hypothetical protein